MFSESNHFIVAGEYVLGTLPADEREQLHNARHTDADLNAEIEAWERRLSPLLADTPSVAPFEQLWKNIEAHISKPASGASIRLMEQRMHRWQQVAIAASIVALLAIAGGLYSIIQPSPTLHAVALLQKTTDPTAFLLRLNEHDHSVTVNIQAAKMPENASYELWIIANDKTPPKSLGILTAAKTTLPFDPSALKGVALANATFAISVEPKGGSPTGLPTGPVISTGKLTVL